MSSLPPFICNTFREVLLVLDWCTLKWWTEPLEKKKPSSPSPPPFPVSSWITGLHWNNKTSLQKLTWRLISPKYGLSNSKCAVSAIPSVPWIIDHLIIFFVPDNSKNVLDHDTPFSQFETKRRRNGKYHQTTIYSSIRTTNNAVLSSAVWFMEFSLLLNSDLVQKMM